MSGLDSVFTVRVLWLRRCRFCRMSSRTLSLSPPWSSLPPPSAPTPLPRWRPSGETSDFGARSRFHCAQIGKKLADSIGMGVGIRGRPIQLEVHARRAPPPRLQSHEMMYVAA